MLILYRKNPGFEGEIIKIERQQTAPELEGFMEANPDYAAEVDFIDVDESSLDRRVLKAMAKGLDDFLVDVKTKQLLYKGAPVPGIVRSEDVRRKILQDLKDRGLITNGQTRAL